MRAIWSVATITFKEGIRTRAIYAISFFALLVFAGFFLVAPMIMQEVGKVAVDMSLSTVSFAGLLMVLFVGINLMAKDLDKRTIYMVLARPISRYSYVTGKFLGIVLLIIVTVTVLSLFALTIIALAKGMYPVYFMRFSLSVFLLALLFITLSLILLSAISFLFASFTSSSFTTLVLTVITYIIGHSINDIKAMWETSEVSGIAASASTVKLVQIASYLFPNFSMLDIKVQAAHAIAVPASYALMAATYSIVYTVIVITLASLIFTRREFP